MAKPMKGQHPDDVEYFEQLRALGEKVAAAAGIRCDVIEPKRRPGGVWGVAYVNERRIGIEVRFKAYAYDGGEWAPMRHSHDENVETLAHELAHLLEYQRYGSTGHTPRFKAIERELVELARELDTPWATTDHTTREGHLCAARLA